jgi:ferrous iron transport protein B
VGSSAENDGIETIKTKMANERYEDGTKVFTFASGISLLLFYAFAMQCMSTLAIVKRETKSWKWPMIQLVGMSIIAYIFALISFQILN